MSVEHCIPLDALTDPKQQEGPAGSDADEQSPEAFRGIPFDVKDYILSLIDSPRDLLSLSLTSRGWSAMILPLHIRYRELRIRANQPEIWQHLATRMDLAKNIRKVCLMAPGDRRDQRLPLTLNKTHHVVKDNHAQPEMIQALSHFESLTSFTWLESGLRSQFTEGVFDALAKCHGLVELILGDVPRKDHLNPESSFTSCRFHSLVKLHLSTGYYIGNGDFLTINKLIIDFLFAHPTIQEFSWYPFGPFPVFLPQGLLPTLKHLFTHPLLAAALLRDNTVIKSRMLETISDISSDLNTMRILGTINGSRLQEIHLLRCRELHHGIETIRRLAVLFPAIKTLELIGRGISLDTYNQPAFDKYIDCFGEFPLLENLYDVPLWRAIHSPKIDKKEEIIKKLYTRCSALKTVGAIMQLGREIVFFRDGLDVTWEHIVKDL